MTETQTEKTNRIVNEFITKGQIMILHSFDEGMDLGTRVQAIWQDELIDALRYSLLLKMMPKEVPKSRWQRFKNKWSWRLTKLKRAWTVLKHGDLDE